MLRNILNGGFIVIPQKIEGLILYKVNYKERNLLAKVLLRSGQKVTILFYGGAGGGSKKKSCVVELGYMLSINLRPSTRKSEDLHVAKEWNVLWAHQHIRYNYPAYQLACQYLEICEKVATESDLGAVEDVASSVDQGPFRTLSNALFYLDTLCAQSPFSSQLHFAFFIAKLLGELGLFPQLAFCVVCGREKSGLLLVAEKGGMACAHCAGQDDHWETELATNMPHFLLEVQNKKYKDFFANRDQLHSLCSQYPLNNFVSALSHYFSFHTQIPIKLQSSQMLQT